MTIAAVSPETEIDIPAGLVKPGDFVWVPSTQDWEHVIDVEHRSNHFVNIGFYSTLPGPSPLYVVKCDKDVRVVRAGH